MWIAGFVAWFIQDKQWIPGACIGGTYILGLFVGQPKREGEVWWRDYLRSPLAFGSTLLLFLYFVWLAWTTGGWAPISCIVPTFLFAERDIKIRRSLKENLSRRSVAARFRRAAIARILAGTHPSC